MNIHLDMSSDPVGSFNIFAGTSLHDRNELFGLINSDLSIFFVKSPSAFSKHSLPLTSFTLKLGATLLSSSLHP